MWIYPGLKALIRFSLKTYFRNIVISGKENEPRSGPVIYLANHPGALMDPLAIASQVRTKLSFLGKATLFSGPLGGKILPMLGMIPVYRAKDNPGDVHKNKETFLRCYEHLEKGKSFLMFPEGISYSERKIQDIKTGAARIALETENRNNFKLDLKIQCIGLNYSSAHRFRSDLYLKMGEPIRIAEFEERYKSDPVKAVRELTHKIKETLEALTISLEDEETEKIVSGIEVLYKNQVMKSLGSSRKEIDKEFLISRQIAEAVRWFREHAPERVKAVQEDMDEYFSITDKLGLRHGVIEKMDGVKYPFWIRLKNFMYFTFGFPFFLLGLLVNYLPYRIPGLIADRMATEIEWKGGLQFAFGILVFLLYYTGLCYAGVKLAGNYWVILPVFFGAMLSGLFAYRYADKLGRLRGRWRTLSLFARDASLISRVIVLREGILEEIERGHKEYESRTADLKTAE
jgi:glycerol-3-phosphate O-acyltransferase / dihydroxyacetone phosphate acyltransferase